MSKSRTRSASLGLHEGRRSGGCCPLIIVLMLVGALLVFAQGSALAPFIYTIF